MLGKANCRMPMVPPEMIARLLALLACSAMALKPTASNAVGDPILIRICSAAGVQLAPLDIRNENKPQKQNAGCHALCVGERSKIRLQKPLT